MMAANLLRSTTQIFKRSISLAAVRCGGGPPSKPVDQHKGKIASDDVELPDSLGHAVGVERFELLAEEAGDQDPFNLKVLKRTKGTLEDPTIVTSLAPKRTVGCICQDDTLVINWMTLHKGEPKRCECGFWFKLDQVAPKSY